MGVVRVGDVGKMGVLSMEVLVEATGRCVREMRMRDQGLGGGEELGRRAMEKRGGAHNVARRCRMHENPRASLCQGSVMDAGHESISSISKDIDST